MPRRNVWRKIKGWFTDEKGRKRPITEKSGRKFKVKRPSGVRREQFTEVVIDKDVLDVPENRKVYEKMKRALREAGIRYVVGPQGGVYVMPKDEKRALEILDPYYDKLK
jgi:hypothetical protein